MLGKNIKWYRNKLGLSQRALVRVSDVRYSELSKIEARYIQNPGVITVKKIADALCVTIDDLMNELESAENESDDLEDR
jgi:transcriptional regulator with XRE-family HTH domain